MSVLPAPSFPTVPGEDPGPRVWRIAMAFVGCVPLGPHPVRRDELAALVGRGVDDESVVAWQTNCCTFALGVLAAADIDYHGLQAPLINGQEFGVLVALGVSRDAWRDPAVAGPPPVGALCWYRIAGTNDDHVEVCGPGDAEHCGGGRPLNAVTHDVGPVALSCGRPLHRWLDPEALGIEIVEDAAPDTEPAAAT